MDQGIKSRPVYHPLRLDSSGLRHLAVSDQDPFPVEAFETAVHGVELWRVARRDISEPGIFVGQASLLSVLGVRLRAERVGFRLYAAGTEGFIWDAANIAYGAGLSSEEVFLAQAGSLRRRVYCTHCKALIENVATNLVPCLRCGATLFVRDHFSRRLGAYMGVQADAEEPGHLPPLQILYP